jgi:polysaccharide transporter, PST family
MLQKVVHNTIWQLADKVFRLGGALLLGIWIARYLGPDSFGLLSFVVALVALFAPIADGGTQSVIVRELVKRQSEHARIMQSVLVLRLTYAIAAIALAVGSAWILRPADTQIHWLVGIVALSMIPQAWDVVDYEYQSQLRSRPIMLARAASFSVFALIKTGLILFQGELEYFAWAIAAEAAVSALIMRCLPAARSYLTGWAHVSFAEVRYFASTCWPMAVAGLSVMLYMRIDQVMLGQMLGERDVGIFSAAVSLSESWYFIPVSIISSVAPALLMAQAENEESYRRKLLKVTRGLFWLAMTAAAILSVESKAIIELVYGPGYAESAAVLAVQAWAGVFVALGVSAGPWFVNAGFLRFRMFQTLAGAVINILMNLALMPRFGPVGAAYATLASQCVSAFLSNAASRSTRPIFFIQLKAALI